MTAISPSGRLRTQLRGVWGYAIVAAAVWLGWEVLKVPIVERSPPAVALRLAPASPEALRRGAEGELLGEDWEDAAFLAGRSLAAAPFNARALRVRGLAEARTGDAERANELLTLAGNWSLRDDPTHAWLVEHRLRQGDYGSAFAHADTLARRRRDLHQQVFNLFTTAAQQDRRALPPLIGLLQARPPWRGLYLAALQRREDGDALLLTLGVSLERTNGPLTDLELQRLYQGWAGEAGYPAIRALRQGVGRPSLESEVQNGDFAQDIDDQLPPFGWDFRTASGLGVEVMEDDLQRGNPALRVSFDGSEGTFAAHQLLLLAPGRYTLSARYRQEAPSPPTFEWSITCAEGGTPLTTVPVPASDSPGAWAELSGAVVVPAGCTAQRLVLRSRPTDRRTSTVVWFDDISLRPADTAASPRQ